MNIFSIICILAVAHGLVLGLVFLFSAKRANIFLGGLVLTLSLGLLTNAVLVPLGYYSTGNEIPVWLFYSLLWIAPFFYFYVYFCTHPDRRWKNSYIWALVPGFADMFISSVVYIGGTYFGHTIFPYPLFEALNILVEPIAYLATLIVFVFIWNMINSYHHKIRNQFSDIQAMQLHWLKRLMVICCIALIFWVMAGLMDIFVGGQVPWLEWMFHVLWLAEALIIFVIGYKAYSFPEVFREQEINDFDKSADPGKKEVAFSKYNDQTALEKIHLVMSVHKKYRQPKLSLKSFAQEAELPIRYVSYLLNHHLQITFHDFVNSYRVKEVLQKLTDPAYRHYTLLALGLEAGFNSKSALHYNFKKHTGSSPTAYVKNQSKTQFKFPTPNKMEST